MTQKEICELLTNELTCTEAMIDCYGREGINEGFACPHAESLRCNKVGAKQASVEWLEQNKEAE